MAEVGWFSGVINLLDARLKNKGVEKLITGGWTLSDPPERIARPYGIFVPTAVRNHRFTAQSKYADLEFDFEVYTDKFSTLDDQICPAVTAALQNSAPFVSELVVNVTGIRPGDIEYEKTDQIWQATIRFVVFACQPAAQNVR